jgi:transposase
MGSWRTRDELVHQIVRLRREGVSGRAIARAVGVSRNTVKAVLAAHDVARSAAHSALPSPPARAPRAKTIDRFAARVSELLTTYPGITAQRVFEILTGEGFPGGYTAVKKYVRAQRPKKKPEPSLTAPTYSPGEMAESDWSPYEITFTSGVRQVMQAFSYVLVYSTRKYLDVFLHSNLYALMDGHVGAFQRFAGCAQVTTYDSQKPVVLRWEGQQPIYNPRFLAFAAHYEFRPRAVRGDPNAKPRVERSFWEFERSFLNGRSFRDLDDLRVQLGDWLDSVADPRRRRLSAPSSLDRFVEEKDKLIPLPRHAYDTARVAYRVCSIDGFVDWEGNHYAVPYDHITDILPVRVTQRELFVYAADLSCIAQHELAARGAGLKLDRAGLHPPPRRKSPVDVEQLAVVFRGLGEGGTSFFRLLSAGPARALSHQARSILLLRARYDSKDLDAALAHAARFGALEHRAVERILQVRAAPRTLDEYVAEQTARRLEQTLGEVRTGPRDLTEYDRLPPTRPPVAQTPESNLPCPSEPTRADLSGPATTSSTGSDDTSTSSA